MIGSPERNLVVGDRVDFFNMSLPLNAYQQKGPGPYTAVVVKIRVGLCLDLSVRGKGPNSYEMLVNHRNSANGVRFWDWPKE